MLRHLLTAALRNMAANRLQSAIAIGGLAIGLAAVILAGIVVRNQTGYDNFIPGHERLYYAIYENRSGSDGFTVNSSPQELASVLRQYPELEDVTRINGETAVFSRGFVTARDGFYWVDPNFFRLMPLPLLYGDLANALSRPDGAVISLSMARKYFSRDDPVGQILQMDHEHAFIVRAVIADPPLNATTLEYEIFISALAPFSTMSELAGKPGLTPNGTSMNMRTVAQLRRGASLENFTQKVSAWVAKTAAPTRSDHRSMHFAQLAEVHYAPLLTPDIQPRLYILGGASLLILVLAAANFINLLVARSVQRGKEVAVRKVAGAHRASLVIQFLGESLFQAAIALCLALALLEWTLPVMNNFLQSGATLDYWRDPALLAALVGGTVLVGVAAGFYPALVLSGFRPASALKGLLRASPVGDRLREILVALQFAALIALLISAATVFQQNQFTTTQALKVDTDQILLIKLKACDQNLRNRIAGLPGVRAAACTGHTALSQDANYGKGGLSLVSAEPGFFELYGLKPLAGQFPRSQSGNARYVINDTARRQLKYATPQTAIGKLLVLDDGSYSEEEKNGPVAPDKLFPLKGTIVGVVPDFTLDPPKEEIPSTAYAAGTLIGYLNRPLPSLLHVKLKGQELPQTVAAIDLAWKQNGSTDPIDRFFLDARIQELQIAVTRQGQLFAAFACVAMMLACLGLFGIALSIVTRRTKEIGVRKAMGASTPDIVRLLLWQFAKPVLWANLLAWPLAWYFMNDWLSGFIYRIDLDWRVFTGATLATLAVAILTVAVQSIAVARAVPATALRYE